MNIPRLIPLWRRLLLAVAGLVTALALLFAVENWRGRRAWSAEKARLAAEGISLDPAAYLPPPIADDANFMATPFFRQLNSARPSDAAWVERFKAFERTSQDIYGTADDPTHFYVHGKDDHPKEELMPQEALARFAPIEADVQALRLSAHELSSSQFLAAASLTRKVLNDWPGGNWRPDEFYLFGRSLPWRIQAELKLGRTSDAFADSQIMLLAIKAVHGSPSILAALITEAMVPMASTAFKTGCDQHQWTSAQLVYFESAFSSFDRWAAFARGFNDERAIATEAIGGRLKGPIWNVLPSGWLEQNKVSLSQAFEDFSWRYNPAERRIDPQVERKISSYAKPLAAIRPYTVVSRTILIKLVEPSLNFARRPPQADGAATVAALERYRVARGAYPQQLENLVPEFIERLPRNVIDGSLPRYSRIDPDHFKLTFPILKKDDPSAVWTWQN